MKKKETKKTKIPIIEKKELEECFMSFKKLNIKN